MLCFWQRLRRYVQEMAYSVYFFSLSKLWSKKIESKRFEPEAQLLKSKSFKQGDSVYQDELV